MASKNSSDPRRASTVPPVVVCSIREADAASFQRSFSRVPAGCGLVEIRADDLRTEEVAEVVKAAARPLIVTLRRRSEGGGFDGSEEDRSAGLRAALEAGARFVDVEWGSPQQVMAEGEHASRVILSYHGSDCSLAALTPIWRSMASSAAARLKIVPAAAKPADGAVIRELLRRARGDSLALACFAMGRAGALTRLMAPVWGSWATYGSLEAGSETAPGQFTATELLESYDVLRIGASTRIFALLGHAVSGSPSPAMHQAAYREAAIDARYLPLELDALEDCRPLLGTDGLIGVEAFAVTIPFKEEVAAVCRLDDEVALAAESVNTVLVGDDGWCGYNTDGPAVVDLVRSRLDPRGVEVAIVGAGGTARAAAVALAAAGSHVTLFNRTPDRARAVARRLGVQAADLRRLPGHAWQVLVQATPLGAAGERLLAREELCGRMVLDAVYGGETPLVRDAREKGLAVADGLDLLVAQAVPQFERMTGGRAREATMREAGRNWLAGRAVNLP